MADPILPDDSGELRAHFEALFSEATRARESARTAAGVAAQPRNTAEFALPSAVTLRTRTSDGVLLHDLMAYLQQRLAAARSSNSIGCLQLRNSRIIVTYAEAADTATNGIVQAALTDATALAALVAANAPPATAAAARATLQNGALSDAEWLKLFRQYQVKLLSGAWKEDDASHSK
jgi:hypothetical protein